MKRFYFHSFLALTLLTSFSLIASGCTPTQSASGQEESIPSVKVIKLGSAAKSGLMASGKVLPDQEVQLVSKLAGKVAQVKVTEGTRVKQGDELVKLEEDDLILQVKQAESGIAASQAKLADAKAGAREQEIRGLQAAVASTRATLEQAKAGLELAKSAYSMAQTSYNRTNSLFESGAVPQAEMDRVSLELDRAKSALDQASAQQEAMKDQLAGAQAKLDLAKSGATANAINALQADVSRAQSALELTQNSLDHTSIKAPIDGIVVQRNIEPGEMAQPGVSLLTLVKMDQVQIQVSVAQEHINEVKQGAAVDVRLAGAGDQVFKGIVEFVSPVSDPNSSQFPVKVKVDNKKGLLRAGMVAEVYFNGGAEAMLEIPKTSLIQKDNKSYVFTYDSGTAHLVEVNTKEKNPDWLYVVSGLKERAQVIINPTDALKDGSAVRVN